MNKYFIIALSFLVFACKEVPKDKITTNASEMEVKHVEETKYPKELFKVFEAHGGLDQWKTYRTLSFDIPNEGVIEKQVIDLYKRSDKVTTPTFSLGYDGDYVWLLDPSESYTGKPKFYHNLMFYFYAMPFVIADNSINYEEVAPLVVDGVSYPGYKITYNAGVGASSKDHYYLHYDANTFQMKWLGYTVTYFSNETSDKVNWVNYNDWGKVDELLRPKSITWHLVENGELKGPRNTVNFENASLSKTAMPNEFYAKPENGKVIVD